MRKQYKNKKAFAMIMAIGFLVVLGTILALSISLTSTTTKRNIEMYFYEQAEILADSAREYAMFRIGNTPCVQNSFNFTQDNFYNISISIHYVTAAGCGAAALNYINDAAFTTDTSLTHEAAVVDVTVSINKANANIPEDIRYFKRYIENIKQ